MEDSMTNGQPQERNVFLRILVALLWLVPCLYILNIIAGILGGLATIDWNAVDTSGGYEAGQAISAQARRTFFAKYGGLVYVGELIVWLSLSVTGIFPWTGKYITVHSPRKRLGKDKPLLGLSALFQKTAVIYRGQWRLFILLGLLTQSGYIVADVIGVTIKDPLINVMMQIAATMIYLWGSIALTRASAKLLSGESVTVEEANRGVAGCYWRYLLGFVLYVGLVFVGTLLLIIPGLYWGTIFGFAYIPIVLEGKGVREAFQISREMVEGYFWILLLLGVCFLVVGGAIGSLVEMAGPLNLFLRGVWGVIFISFITAYELSLYQRLKAIKTAVSVEPVKT